MQRTERELMERYFARIRGIHGRLFAKCADWSATRKGRMILKNLGMTGYRSSNTEYWIAACKALGHWPRRES